MSDLHPCEKCQRHIRGSETVCPFCGAAASSIRGSARATILAGALLGATSLGCSESKPKAEAPPPIVEPAANIAIDATPAAVLVSDAAAPEPADAGAADAAPVVKKQKKKRKEEVKAVPIERPLPPMPYGAPPARRRVV